ncbi:hypothetical protein F5Y18DRAFT_234590 [Xylariaceae sp. FL1019]|nr:hypothetical protein F5Y18DRAFT_234590 [Xylariaceae sp. FL1019]
MRTPNLYDAARVLSQFTGLQKPLTGTASKGVSDPRLLLGPEVPGGTPFSFCDVSRPTDLLNVTSLELTQQPVHFDEEFFFNLYGIFQKPLTPNATINAYIDCGSHCEDYGNPPGERPGAGIDVDFCEFTQIQQPLGGLPKRNTTCPPVAGYALSTSMGYLMPMFFRTPGWYNFTFDAHTAEGDRIYCVTTEVCLRWEDEEKNKGHPPGPWTNCTWPR